MFDFRLINTADGNQIIDRTLKTPYTSLTPPQMIEYIEIDNKIAYIESIEKKQKREAEKQRKLAKNPLWKLACFCGVL